MKKILLLLTIFITSLFASVNIPSINALYTHGNISVSSQVQMGDLIISLAIGLITYILMVTMFLTIILKIPNEITQGGKDEHIINVETIAKVFFKPFFVLIGTLLLLNFLNLVLRAYNLNIFNQLKFFFEVRYNTMINNLNVSGHFLNIAKEILLIESTASKFAFWSIAFVYAAIIIATIILIFTIFLTYTQRDSLYKRIFTAFGVAIASVVLLGIYSSFLNNTMFKNHPNIPKIGVVYNITNANRKVLIYFAKKGLNNV